MPFAEGVGGADAAGRLVGVATTVTPIDLATNTPGTPITVGDAPFGIAIASVTVPDSADLAVTIGDSADPVALGDSYTYTATVTNNGPSAATGISATVTTPRRATQPAPEGFRMAREGPARVTIAAAP